MAVRSLPVRSGTWSPMTANRVALSGLSSIFSARTFRPYSTPACGLAMAAAPGFSPASWAAVEVLVTSMVRRGQVLGQPIPALADRLRPAVDLFHLRPRTLRQQRMVDVHLDLAADPHRQAGEHRQGVGNPPVGRVLDRHEAEIGMSLVDLFKHGGNGPNGHELDATPKTMNGSQMAVAVKRSEKGDPRLPHQRAASTLNLAEDRPDDPLRQRSAVGLDRARSGFLVRRRGLARGRPRWPPGGPRRR